MIILSAHAPASVCRGRTSQPLLTEYAVEVGVAEGAIRVEPVAEGLHPVDRPIEIVDRLVMAAELAADDAALVARLAKKAVPITGA